MCINFYRKCVHRLSYISIYKHFWDQNQNKIRVVYSYRLYRLRNQKAYNTVYTSYLHICQQQASKCTKSREGPLRHTHNAPRRCLVFRALYSSVQSQVCLETRPCVPRGTYCIPTCTDYHHIDICMWGGEYLFLLQIIARCNEKMFSINNL